MRRIYLPVLLFVALLSGCSGRRPPTDETGVLKGLLSEFFRGIEEKDTVKLRQITTADFVLYEEGSVWNNDSGFKNIRRHIPFTVKYVLSNVVVYVDEHSGDARYFNHADFHFRDTVNRSFDWVESATFRNTEDGWKINFLSVAQRDGYTPPRYDTVRFIPEHYAKRVAQFRKEPMKQGGVIFFGNSLVEYGDWKKLFGDSGVVNRGIAGDNTFGMLERLDEVIARRPKELYIEAGVNDLGQDMPPGLVMANILTLVGRVQLACPETTIYVQNLLPSNDDCKKEYPEIWGRNAVIEELDRDLRRAVEEKHVVYIDLKAAVRDANGNLDHRYARPDGLHLNAAGYDVWVGVLKKAGFGMH